MSRLFAAKELRESNTVQIGCRDKWVSIVCGDFMIRWKSFDGRFPKVGSIIPDSESMTSWLELDEQDAAFAMKRIDNMSGEKDEFRPVTLDLNGHVAIRSADKSGTNAAELELVNSRYSGSETRVAITRDFLKHALTMGLTRIGLDGSERQRAAGPQHASHSDGPRVVASLGC